MQRSAQRRRTVMSAKTRAVCSFCGLHWQQHVERDDSVPHHEPTSHQRNFVVPGDVPTERPSHAHGGTVPDHVAPQYGAYRALPVASLPDTRWPRLALSLIFLRQSRQLRARFPRSRTPLPPLQSQRYAPCCVQCTRTYCFAHKLIII
ncbi:hypothetical protein GQ600_13690 [Phytophthora cactorum]|nr:hypothetical protein GQ600_13690 [Phytophthora cactorum]